MSLIVQLQTSRSTSCTWVKVPCKIDMGLLPTYIELATLTREPAMHHQVTAPHDPTNLDMRQLRHHTKNALARILAQVSSQLSNSSASRRVANDVERRVLLTASISDALFGLTRTPGPIRRAIDRFV